MRKNYWRTAKDALVYRPRRMQQVRVRAQRILATASLSLLQRSLQMQGGQGSSSLTLWQSGPDRGCSPKIIIIAIPLWRLNDVPSIIFLPFDIYTLGWLAPSHSHATLCGGITVNSRLAFLPVHYISLSWHLYCCPFIGWCW